MQYRFILLVGLIVFTSSCEKDLNRECSGICTEEFRTITAEITDAEANPVLLDSLSIIDITNDLELDLSLLDSQFENGFYTIFNDNFVSEYRNQEISLHFRGFQEGELIVTETYKVGADCCHVYYISGPLEIILD